MARLLGRCGFRFEAGEHLFECCLVGADERVGVRGGGKHLEELGRAADSGWQVGAQDQARVDRPQRGEAVSFIAGTASSQEFPEHGHLLLTGLEYDAEGEPIGYKKCRELANGQALRLNAHHEHLHFGKAGDAQWNKAGNAIVPLAPFFDLPWTNCEEFAAIVFSE